MSGELLRVAHRSEPSLSTLGPLRKLLFNLLLCVINSVKVFETAIDAFDLVYEFNYSLIALLFARQTVVPRTDLELLHH